MRVSQRVAFCRVCLRVLKKEVGLVSSRLVMWVLRRVICVVGRVGGDWRRRLLGSGGVVVGGRRVVVGRVLVRARVIGAEPVMMMMMLEELEGVEVVAAGVRRSLGGAVQAAVVGGLALLEGVSRAAVVELDLHCDLTTLFEDIHARPLSTSRYCLGANGRARVDSYFESDLVVCLPLAETSSPALELDLLVAVPVAHARTLLHAPWLLPAVSRVL